MDAQDPRLLKIWQQKGIPVIYRQSRPNPVLVRIPYSSNNFAWIRGEKRHKPEWNLNYKCWETPVAWFDDLIERTLR
ncbi:MAG TPA: hypothetical protein VN114_05735, partial [Oxalicibacterium sp.]|nr:hypothetical protein [Oxalicibacterium sp.]